MSETETKPYPWFYAVNDRPVKFEQTPSGGLRVLVYDFASGELTPDMSYLSAPFKPGADVDELSAEKFELLLTQLRSQR